MFSFVLVAAFLTAGSAAGSPVEPYFEPWQSDCAALSPDGLHLAYLRGNGSPACTVVIAAVDDPAKSETVRLPGSNLEAALGAWALVTRAAPLFAERARAAPPRLVWTDAARVVVESSWEAVFAVTVDGRLTRLGDPRSAAYELPPLDPKDKPVRRARPWRVVSAGPQGVVAEAQGTLVALPGFRGPRPRSLEEMAKIDYERAAYQARLRDPIPTELFQVDLASGRQTPLEKSSLAGLFIYDRTGKPRILLVGAASRAQHYEYSEDFFQAGGRPLDELFPKGSVSFRIDPQNYLRHRSIPLGFDGNPSVLYYASNVGRDDFLIFGCNVRTGAVRAVTSLGADAPGISGQDLVFDPNRPALEGIRGIGPGAGTVWTDPEILQVQTTLEGKLPERLVEILNWDLDRNRFLVLAATPSDPGRYFVFDRHRDLLFDFGRRAPDLNRAECAPVDLFEFPGSGGKSLTCRVTHALAPRTAAPPLVILCRDSPWDFPKPGFDRQAQALAGSGLLVAEVHYRGAAGLGVRFRDSLSASAEPGPVDDVRAAIAWLSLHVTFDPKRVAMVGCGLGGVVACRALAEYPGEFRCGVCIDAPLDLARWVDPKEQERQRVEAERKRAATGPPRIRPPGKRGGGKGGMSEMSEPTITGRERPDDFLAEVRGSFLGASKSALAAASPALHPESIRLPLFIIQSANSPLSTEPGRALREALLKENVPAAFLEIDQPLATAPLEMQEGVSHQVVQFLNLSLYSYGVHIGDLKSLGNPP